VAETEVSTLPPLPMGELPTQVTIRGTPDVRMSPNQMRALKAETGKSLDELMGEGAEEADRLQAIAWLELRKAGFAVSWDDVADVLVEIETEEADPFNGGS
jgi:hypothetical protein